MNFLKTAVYPYLKRYFLILMLAGKRFYRGSRLLWAASLTFTTVFSLVPLLSVLFYLFNAFGALSDLKTIIQPYIYRSLAPGAQERVLSIIDKLVNGVDFATIGALGSTVLIISVFLLLFEIEYALNEIWVIKNKMSIISRAAVYWTIITIGPLLLAATLFIFTAFEHLRTVQYIKGHLPLDISPGFSYGLLCTCFTFLYYFMPGTRVRAGSALFGGILTGTFWKIAATGFTFYASNFVFYYPKVYGPLAAFPVFLLWLFLCWILFLLGADITYLHQHYSFHKTAGRSIDLSRGGREYFTLLVFFEICKRFLYDAQPPTLASVAHSLRIPVHMVQELTSPLREHGILIESRSRSHTVIPGKPLSKMPLSEVIERIHRDSFDVDENESPDSDSLCKHVFRSLHPSTASIYRDKTIQDLILGNGLPRKPSH